MRCWRPVPDPFERSDASVQADIETPVVRCAPCSWVEVTETTTAIGCSHVCSIAMHRSMISLTGLAFVATTGCCTTSHGARLRRYRPRHVRLAYHPGLFAQCREARGETPARFPARHGLAARAAAHPGSQCAAQSPTSGRVARRARLRDRAKRTGGQRHHQ